MKTPDLEVRRIFLIAAPVAKIVNQVKSIIESHVTKAIIFVAQDGQDALFKSDNAPPQVAFLHPDISKVSAMDITKKLLERDVGGPAAIIWLAPAPEKELFVDEVVTGRVQFLSSTLDEAVVANSISKALNSISANDQSSYRIKFLMSGEVLFAEGSKAESVFIVKKGELEAYKKKDNQEIILGKIKSGEFVGEMAHFNSDLRSASVRALVDTELIEIPCGALDTVLFSKPAWSKALIATLSRRLKNTNTMVKS